MLPPLLDKVPGWTNMVYDEDYVMLGFYAGGEATAKALAADIKSIVTVDMRGNKVGDLKMMEGINTVADFDLIINHGECNTYIMFQMSKPYGVTTIMSCLIFGLAPDILPQYEAGVVQGVIAGIRGGAEYEFIMKAPGVGIAGIDAISTSHSMVVILLIIGNIGMLAKKLSGEE
jgi:hypothetical protein